MSNLSVGIDYFTSPKLLDDIIGGCTTSTSQSAEYRLELQKRRAENRVKSTGWDFGEAVQAYGRVGQKDADLRYFAEAEEEYRTAKEKKRQKRKNGHTAVQRKPVAKITTEKKSGQEKGAEKKLTKKQPTIRKPSEKDSIQKECTEKKPSKKEPLAKRLTEQLKRAICGMASMASSSSSTDLPSTKNEHQQSEQPHQIPLPTLYSKPSFSSELSVNAEHQPLSSPGLDFSHGSETPQRLYHPLNRQPSITSSLLSYISHNTFSPEPQIKIATPMTYYDPKAFYYCAQAQRMRPRGLSFAHACGCALCQEDQ